MAKCPYVTLNWKLFLQMQKKLFIRCFVEVQMHGPYKTGIALE